MVLGNSGIKGYNSINKSHACVELVCFLYLVISPFTVFNHKQSGHQTGENCQCRPLGCDTRLGSRQLNTPVP